MQSFKAKNQWLGKGNLPKSGNIIFFDWDGDSVSDHVGIVEKVENNIVYTIEGNSGDKIAKLSYEKKQSLYHGIWDTIIKFFDTLKYNLHEIK